MGEAMTESQQTNGKMYDYDAEDGHMMAAMMPPGWVGMARSFEEADAVERSQRSRTAVKELSKKFWSIAENILNAEDLTESQKADQIVQAAIDFRERVPDALDDAAEKARPGLIQRIKAAFKAEPAAEPEHDPGAFAAFKDRRGNYRWLAVYSNPLWDRDGERFTAAAHAEFADWAKATNAMPALRLFHVPGTDIGKADALDYTTDGFMVATGTFLPGAEKAAAKLAARSPLGVSHGFTYSNSDLRDGEYHRYRTFEISAVPAEAAANQYGTAFAAGEALPMISDEKTRSFLVDVLGEEDVAQLETKLATANEELTRKGHSFKAAMDDLIANIGRKTEVDTTQAAPASTDTGATDSGAIAEGAAPAQAADGGDALTRLEQRIEQLAGAIEQQGKTLQESTKAIGARVDALERSDDEKVAERMAPGYQPRQGFQASKSDETVASGEEADQVKDAMKQANDGNGNVPEHLAPFMSALGIGNNHQ